MIWLALGIAATAFGGVSVGVGASALGVGLTQEASAESLYQCEGGDCPVEAAADLDAATDAQVAGGVLLAAGGVALAVGIPVLVLSQSDDAAAALRVTPGGVELVGRF